MPYFRSKTPLTHKHIHIPHTPYITFYRRRSKNFRIDWCIVGPGHIFGEFITSKKQQIVSEPEEQKFFNIIFGFAQSYMDFFLLLLLIHFLHVLPSLYNIYARTRSVMRCVWLTLWVLVFPNQCKISAADVLYAVHVIRRNCSFQSQDACFWKEKNIF